MTARKALLMVGLGAILTSTAMGGAPMGPPRALMGEGNWGVGFEYGHESADLQASGTVRAVVSGVPFDFIETIQVDDLRTNMFFGTIGYGVCDNWDLFVRLGASDARDDVTARANIPRDLTNFADDFGVPQEYAIGSFDSSYGFAWGVGSRATFCRSGPWSFGGLVQATWFKPGDSDIAYTDPIQGAGAVHTGEMSLDFWVTQVSLAVSFQADTVYLWAGPFLQFVEGDLDRKGDIFPFPADTFTGTSELREESQIGAHVGLDWAISEQFDLWVEGQITGDSWLVGIGLVIGLQQTYGM